MAKSIGLLYWTIEINLICWVATLGALISGTERGMAVGMALAGFVLAAALQHWAYYHLRKVVRTS